MNRKNVCENDCPILYTLMMIGGKWRMPILCQLLKGETRYNRLKSQLNGITNIMLTRSLQDLEECGLVKRIQYDENPPHVGYALTEDAKRLLPAIRLLKEWGNAQMMMNNLSSIACETTKCRKI